MGAEEKVDGEQYHLYRDVYERQMAGGSGLEGDGPLAKELLNTIDTMVYIFRRFRTFLRRTDTKVRIEGPRDPGTFTVDANTIQDAMKKWTATLSIIPPRFYKIGDKIFRDDSSGEHSREFEGHRKLAIETLHGRGSLPRNFHCELQLMDRFLDDEDVYNYIA